MTDTAVTDTNDAPAARADGARKKNPQPEVIYAVSWPGADSLSEEIVVGRHVSFVSRHRDGTQGQDEARELVGRGVLKPYPLDDLDALKLRLGGGEIVLLAGMPTGYGTTEELDRRIGDHIARFAVVPAEIAPVLPLYVRYTWLADRFQTAPYLRLFGPSGSGKSRTSRVIGHLCRKPYMTNSTASEASLNRTLEMLGICTTVIDENEYDDSSDAQVAITKMLRVGFEANGVVERCEEVERGGRRRHLPVRLPVFGPKIFCAIEHVPDQALQSRSIPVSMVETKGVPIELPNDYLAQVMALQGMLLQYRLNHYFSALPEPTRLDVSGRLLQLYWPLARVATASQLPALDALILELQEEREAAVDAGPEPKYAAAIRKLAEDSKVERVEIDSVAKGAGLLPTNKTRQKIGYFLSDLGLKRARSKGNRGSRWIDAPKDQILAALDAEGYGVALDQAA